MVGEGPKAENLPSTAFGGFSSVLNGELYSEHYSDLNVKSIYLNVFNFKMVLGIKNRKCTKLKEEITVKSTEET